MSEQVPKQLRDLVRSRAGAKCEYCGVPEDEAGYPHQIDHIRSRKHGGPTVSQNLAWACFYCNLNKGPETAAIDEQTGEAARLYNPRIDTWIDHFRMERGLIVGLTPIGRVTIAVLQFNQDISVRLRQVLIGKGRY